MVRTFDRKTFQIRWDWTWAAVWFGRDKLKAIKLHWWGRPRIVIDMTGARPPVIIGFRYSRYY